MGNNSIIEHRANYHFVALREEFLLICQRCKYKKLGTAKSKNKASLHCKALILDILEHWTNTKRDKGVSFAVFMTYEQWSDAMYGMFGRNVIIDSLDELIGEGLITREPYMMYGKKTFQYYLNYQDLNHRIKQLPAKSADNLLPQKEAFTNKPDDNNTHLQVNGNAFTNKPDTRLQINDEAFTSNHNLDTTQIHNTDSSKTEGEEEATSTSKKVSILSSDQQQFFNEIYCHSKIGKVIPDSIDETLKGHIVKLMGYTKTVEELDSLYEYVQKRLLESNLKDKTVYTGNLTNAKYLGGWLQEQERKEKELACMDPYVRAVMQSAGQLQASTPGSQYIVDTLSEAAEAQLAAMSEEEITREAIRAYYSQPTINGMPNFAASGIKRSTSREKKHREGFITSGPLAGQPDFHADPWT